MEKGAYQRSIIALIVGIIVVVILYFLVPAPDMGPRGILLPTGKLMAPISSDQVVFYNSSSFGASYQKVGYINVQYHSITPTAQNEQVLANYVKQLAAASGANGVIITLFGHTLPNEVPNSQASYVFRGEAVYTAPNT